MYYFFFFSLFFFFFLFFSFLSIDSIGMSRHHPTSRIPRNPLFEYESDATRALLRILQHQKNWTVVAVFLTGQFLPGPGRVPLGIKKTGVKLKVPVVNVTPGNGIIPFFLFTR